MERMDRIVEANKGAKLANDYVQVMFHADLGGETLDVLLAMLDGASFRVLAAESTRIGADILRSVVSRKTKISEDIKKAVLSRLIRIGKLDDEIDRVLSAGQTAAAS